ncbi:hypothetical protein LEP1GSC074_3516 [Leptospira noguchii str. Hook]|nr:hypothetical protein LEP1GSC041_4094 [Leptospira noguchii str. 2006001870]EMS83533.1 hypothetical protein LEP1GSC074_3516 [Leptospira noguchii str. Hook]
MKLFNNSNEKKFSKYWVPTILEFVRKIVICGSSYILRMDL